MEALPQPIPAYRLVRELGRGHLGVVYLAIRPADAAVVALKTIRTAVAGNSEDVARFLHEANALRDLHHPHLIRCREIGTATGLLYVTSDYVPGPDANRLVLDQGPMPVRRAVGLIRTVLEVLEYAHARGQVHRDLKPANLLVTANEHGEQVHVADFGLARVYQASKLSGLTMMSGGAVGFMPPEQITHYRQAHPAGDQFSAAATLYFLLTGQIIRNPSESVSQNLLTILESAPIPIHERRPDLPEDLATVIHRALSRKLTERFPGVKALREALLPFA